jgi:hypothetical protein
VCRHEYGTTVGSPASSRPAAATFKSKVRRRKLTGSTKSPSVEENSPGRTHPEPADVALDGCRQVTVDRDDPPRAADRGDANSWDSAGYRFGMVTLLESRHHHSIYPSPSNGGSSTCPEKRGNSNLV